MEQVASESQQCVAAAAAAKDQFDQITLNFALADKHFKEIEESIIDLKENDLKELKGESMKSMAQMHDALNIQSKHTTELYRHRVEMEKLKQALE